MYCANDTEVCCYTTPAATQPKLKGLVSDMFQLTVPLVPLSDLPFFPPGRSARGEVGERIGVVSK